MSNEITKQYWSNQIPAPETRKRLEEGEKRFNSIDIGLINMKNQIERFSDEMREWKTENAKQHEDILKALKDIKSDSVSQIEFTPIRKLVYGAAGFILFAVLSAIVYLVIKDKV